jgi:maleate isomerase
MTKPSDDRKRIAVLIPSSNTVLEADLHRELPTEKFVVLTSRMYLTETTRQSELAMIEKHAPRGATDLGTAYPHLFVFGCTSAGSLFGLDFDREICKRFGDLAGCPAIGVISSVDRALALANAQRVAVLTPYNEDLTKAVAGSVESGGREVVIAKGLGIEKNFDLAGVDPDGIVDFVVKSLAGVAPFDSIFVSCTNFRAFEARDALKRRFGVPIVTSNSAVAEYVASAFASEKRLEAAAK